jgi:hypothetical protein
VSAPFTVAEAVAAGVGRDRLERLDLARPFWGIRMPAATAADFGERCRAALLACPSVAFLRGASAAMLLGIPIPLRLERRIVVEIGLPAPARAVRRAGIVGRVCTIDDDEIELESGMRATTPARTWCDLALELSVPELVAAGDWMLRARMTTTAALLAAIARRVDRRGTRSLAVAVELLDEAAESPKESELRTLIVLAGLPRPAVNATIRSPEGRFIARVDLLFEKYGEVLEYQGDHHRTDVVQWRRDRTRESELESHGLHVTEVTVADLARPRVLVERVARNLGRRGWQGHPRYSPWFPTPAASREDEFRP